ncbi:DUF116 domain-containing protein [Candidatus Bathyarchaeota archaeon]|nr:DUF116 domain-containing protein [Candidatus Bathyarchaeota archaeon]RLI67287.1 MAG: hypothetical protein DRP02_14695 [Candidatus Gerdarchaeota archaeon]
MPYKFTFDLSRIPRFFFTEITKVGYQKGLHKKIGKITLEIVKKFKIQEMTGLNLSDAVVLLEDLIDIQARNFLERDKFVRTNKRALFLPHCSRKYMDNRCKAKFDPEIPSYICAHCSPDCLINKAVTAAEKKGYDVYIIPGGSCIPKILKAKRYEGVIGVACGEEIKLGGEILAKMGIPGQAVPLIKNGCANTIFSLENLLNVL